MLEKPNVKRGLMSLLAILISGTCGHFYARWQDTDQIHHSRMQHLETLSKQHPRYTFAQCRIWVDYTSTLPKGTNDIRAQLIVRQAVEAFDPYTTYYNWKNFGGTPGFHFALVEHCDKKNALAQKLADDLVARHPYITEAHPVRHTANRAPYDVGRPFWPYYHAPDPS